MLKRQCQCPPHKRRLRVECYEFPKNALLSFSGYRVKCVNCGLHYRWIHKYAIAGFLKSFEMYFV